jgi:hypothetical protein
MTPQERQLVADLFERLAALENQPREPEAEQAIREGLAKAPHAVYALVQSVLVQDEALKQADAHIRELEDALQGGAQPAGQPKGFLDNMRDTLFGREEQRGSVPSVRPGDQPMGAPSQYRGASGAGPSPWGNAGAQPQWSGGGTQQWGGAPQPMPQDAPRGGSFLGTAAAAAAGMVGGGLLLGGIRNMLGGGQHHGPFAGAFDEISGGGSRSGGSDGGALGREAGLDDIGRGGGRAGLFGDNQNQPDTDYRSAGLVDEGETDDAEDSDLDDDVDTDSGSDDTGSA